MQPKAQKTYSLCRLSNGKIRDASSLAHNSATSFRDDAVSLRDEVASLGDDAASLRDGAVSLRDGPFTWMVLIEKNN